MKKANRLGSLVLALILALSLVTGAWAEVSDEVSAKVEALAAECRASGASSDYEIALWMHDWLIYNADYDESLSIHGPEGVLLQGTGVCQSYASAYKLLLEAMGMECQIVVSEAMDHAWNLVKIDGVWVHVDVTWDDPVGDGAEEAHTYFGLSDELISRDHVWEDTSSYPAADSDTHNYYLQDDTVQKVSSQEEFNAAMWAQYTAGANEIKLYNTSADASFSLTDAFDAWLETESLAYNLQGYGYNGSAYYLTVTLKGTYDPGFAAYIFTTDEELEAAVIHALAKKAATVKLVDQMNAAFDAGTLVETVLHLANTYGPAYAGQMEMTYSYGDDYLIIYLTYSRSLALPAQLTEVGDYAFDGNTAITHVRFVSGVTTIGACAFRNCTALLGAVIPDSVTVIGDGAFEGCAELTLYGSENSAAHTYAQTNGISWQTLE